MNQDGEVRIVDLGAEGDEPAHPQAPVRPSFPRSTRFLVGVLAVVALAAALAVLSSSNDTPAPLEADAPLEAPVAVATVSSWEVWMPWLETPDAVVYVTLPSGIPCEHRIVARSEDPAEVFAGQDFLRTTDLLADADIDSELALITISDVPVQDGGSDAVVRPVPYSEDELYRNAVSSAIMTFIWNETEELGTWDAGGVSSLSFEHQTNCVGMAR